MVELICTDCAMWHENGDATGIPMEHRQQVMDVPMGTLVVTGTEPRAFSDAVCSGCDTRVGGVRYEAVWRAPEVRMAYRTVDMRARVYSGSDDHAKHTLYWAVRNSESDGDIIIAEIKVEETNGT